MRKPSIDPNPFKVGQYVTGNVSGRIVARTGRNMVKVRIWNGEHVETLTTKLKIGKGGTDDKETL